MDDGQLTTDRIPLNVVTVGDPASPPMVLLHALGDRGSDWSPVTARLAEHFRIVIPDLRGHGDSVWPGTYSYDLLRDDVIGLLDDLGVHDVTLVGHSLGGVVAYLLAMERPDLVSRLVIEDVTPPYPSERAIPERPDGPLPFDWAVLVAIIGQINEGEPAVWDRLERIAAPTLLIGGGPDSHVPADKLDEVAAVIPTCTLVTIPGGHHVHKARPAEFTDTVLDWLRPVGP